MANRAYTHTTLLIALLTSTTLFNVTRANGVNLYTPYTKISVPPGETVEYKIDVKNTGSTTKNIDLYLSGLPRSWNYTLKAGGYSIEQIAVVAGDKKTVTLEVNIPRKVNKGNHLFKVVARNFESLPLTIHISEQGTFKTEFTSDQINMQGHAKSNFNFSTRLKNQTGTTQVYAFHASPPPGWNLIFRPKAKQATAAEVEPNQTVNVTIEVKPPYNVKAGTYKIPVEASNRSTTASIELEIVISGTYEMELSTPTGLLSSKLTAGKEKRIDLLVVNTGTSELNDIVFRSSKPKSWEINFEPDTIPYLKAGEKEQITAIIKVFEKAIPGDYVANITAQTSEVKAKAAFRISVKTPMIWGWIGIFIVLAIAGAIYFLFRKYGRR